MGRLRTVALCGLAAGAVGLAPSVMRQARALRAVDRKLLGPLAIFPLPVKALAALAKGRPVLDNVFPPDIAGERLSVPAADGTVSVQVVTYEPHARAVPTGALLWVHGGGYVLGDTSMEDTWCAKVARELGILVVSVDYRLAPEHPFPAALDDCFAALSWLVDSSAMLGVDRSRIAVGGESAGGGLAAALVQRAHDADLPVCFQLLVYPMLDDRTVTRCEARGDWALVWTPPANRYGWTSYLGREPGGIETRPYAVPARREDLSGLPPAWIGIGDVDLFHSEDVRYAKRLRQAGVECELYEVPGMFHGADRDSSNPGMKEFTRRKLECLRPHLSPSLKVA